MARLTWGDPGSRLYEVGVDRGVLYLQDGSAVPWNGLIAVKEAPSETDVSVNYVDGIQYRTRHKPGAFAAAIEALTYPDEFEEYGSLRPDRSLRRHKTFGFSYRTRVGDDISGLENGYKIHLVYNALAKPSGVDRNTFSETTEPVHLSWEISTTPIDISGARPSAHLVIDTSIARPSAVEELESLLYGSETSLANLPQPNDVLEVFESNAIVRIVDNGDGTWTATGPDDVILFPTSSTFSITWPSVVYIDNDTYKISSL